MDAPQYGDQWQVDPPGGTVFWVIGESIGSRRLVAQARVTPTYCISLDELEALGAVRIYSRSEWGELT